MKVKARYMIGTVVAAYAMLPVLAGFFVWGDRTGPAIYPAEAHHTLYLIGYAFGDENGKPRVPGCTVFEDRPWFYGMRPRLRTPQEIDAIFDKNRDAHGVLSEERKAQLDRLMEQAKRRTGMTE